VIFGSLIDFWKYKMNNEKGKELTGGWAIIRPNAHAQAGFQPDCRSKPQ
jgi:hypothetical protein